MNTPTRSERSAAKRRRTTVNRLCLTLGALILVDATATVLSTSYLGTYEANPLLSGPVSSLGVVPAMAIRSVLGIAFALVLRHYALADERSRLPTVALIGLVLFFLALSGYHLALSVLAMGPLG